uniref:Uncharacterized protein n=1 Tax=Noctiluca scintillans TaxID=2966 RepID=A0A7S1A531_NOCSC|mmetsp:Transcript_30993/g.82354  ORF Transcript_30993/g.82354 Transcript_30993/m.82354 type:complete len:284 (+) Transcript_30993:72-923(+)
MMALRLARICRPRAFATFTEQLRKVEDTRALPSRVVLHNYRDVTALKRISATGIIGTLTCSSGLVYSLSLNFPPVFSAILGLQSVAAAVVLALYLRTYVARAVLDTRRSQLSVTVCGLFGTASAKEHHLPLTMIESFSKSDKFLKFRLKSAVWNPERWVSYRIPRGRSEAKNRTTAQVESPSAAFLEITPDTPKVVRLSKASGGRRFLGAGLGGATLAENIVAPARPTVVRHLPSAPSDSLPTVSTYSLGSLKLHKGLPVDGAEEQKIVDFFRNPAAYVAGAS